MNQELEKMRQQRDEAMKLLAEYRKERDEFAANYDLILRQHRIAATQRDEVRNEFAIMCKAAGNWREWPSQPPDETGGHPYWQAAARAFIERNELARQLEQANEAKEHAIRDRQDSAEEANEALRDRDSWRRVAERLESEKRELTKGALPAITHLDGPQVR